MRTRKRASAFFLGTRSRFNIVDTVAAWEMTREREREKIHDKNRVRKNKQEKEKEEKSRSRREGNERKMRKTETFYNQACA